MTVLAAYPERRRTWWQKIWDARAAYLFILPAYIPFIVFVLYPLINGLRLSFYEAGVNKAKWRFIGFDNFVRLFTRDDVFIIALKNTFLFVLIVVPVVVVISIFLAVIVFPLPRAAQSFVRMSFYMPVVSGGVVLAMVWIWIFNRDFGLLNYLLELAGFYKLLGIPKIGWLAQTETALLSLAMVVISWSIGQPLILFLAALGNISEELYDAAKIDGASGWQIFWKITLPLLRPTTLFVLVTTTINVFQVFVVVLLMTLGGPANATQTIVYRIYENAFVFYKYGYGAAMGVVLLLIVGSIAYFQFKFLGQEVEY
ncbi:MAG: sugar ABC transporter permease [Anaerolineae bacterium]|nr:sugar ABC transporter permease [Anaerolineae bacterium]